MTALNRRSFMKASAAAWLAAGGVGCSTMTSSNRPVSGKRQPIALGGQPFFSQDDPEAYLQHQRGLGYAAAYCPPAQAGDTDRLRAIESAFKKHNLINAEVGRWCNLLEADPAKRKAHLDHVIDGLAVADATGARCCVNIAGSYNEEVWYGPHPDNLSQKFFDATVENARTIIDAVKPKRATFTFEMVGWSWPDSPDAYLKLMKAIDRKAFAVHLDVCNLINSPRRFYDSTAMINECFDTLGPHIMSCHAKDLAWEVEMNIHFKEVPAGTGKVDWATHLRRLSQLERPVPLMIEHCATEADNNLATESLRRIGSNEGVTFA